MKLHLDIETYSSIDLKTSGVYKYVESLDFEILMLAYAFENDPVNIIDLASGEKIPPEVLLALENPQVIKCAHNATFERLCFQAIGIEIPIYQWGCSMVKAAYCGLPLSLDLISKALRLQEKGKLSTGKNLIRYFCNPCKPTKANGQRERNLPQHDPGKWQEFKKYCINDVEAEREIIKRLSKYKLPQFEIDNYILDQEINDRGVLIDLDFAKNAYGFDTEYVEDIVKKIKDITGIENPNSPAQLKEWLSAEMGEEVKTLSRDAIPILLEKTESAAVKKILDYRKRIAKSSTKKYIAMINCAGEDSRSRGLFQFLGANRTGRWAGRLIQLQNLPQNHIKDLETARQLIAEGDYETMTMIYDNISNILSECIRTAFVAKPGHTFVISDFSSIEARVIAWLADEKWRLDVFNTHGKIYEASASMMFKVPIEEITKGSDLRFKGKTAELALGYQGSVGAMTQMSKLPGGITEMTEKEMRSIVKKWRGANRKIVQLWRDVEGNSIASILTRAKSKSRFLEYGYDGKVFTITLPSKRKLFYQSPWVEPNKFNKDAIKFKGMDQVIKQWTDIDTYGGKLVENIVQAISRDLLADAMKRINKLEIPIVMHIHDEIVCEVPINKSEELLDKVNSVLSQDVNWAPGLPLRAEGYISKFYKKD